MSSYSEKIHLFILYFCYPFHVSFASSASFQYNMFTFQEKNFFLNNDQNIFLIIWINKIYWITFTFKYFLKQKKKD